MMNKFMVSAALAGMMMVTGCAKAPTQAISDAEQALLDAEARRKCANEKYTAAEGLLAEAKALVKAEKYDEAERKAKAAQKLAKEARAEADARWEECNRVNEVVQKAKEEPKDDGDSAAQLSTVYFAFDSAELTPSMRSTLDQNVLWARQNAKTGVLLEGHTDERGSVEYNLALGERRAKTAKQYLVQSGIPAARLDIISYGEEKPASFGSSESDFQLNRRVEFVPKR
jgi:peptidoglycan-associated lipoprotein